MNKWNRVKKLKPEKFLQIVGVRKDTFEDIVRVLSKAKIKQKKKGGAPNTLSAEK